MISGKSICNLFCAKLVEWQKLRILKRYPYLMALCGRLLTSKKPKFKTTKICFMHKISYWSIPSHFFAIHF